MSTPHSIRLGNLFPLLVDLIQLTPEKNYLPLVYVNKAAVMTKDLEVRNLEWKYLGGGTKPRRIPFG